MVVIDREKCIGCGQCAGDCFAMILDVKDGKAEIKDGHCIECGHCVAVCPMGAVSLEGYDDEKIIPLKDMDYDIDPQAYLNFIRATRTVRQFKDKKVEKEKIEMMLEGARYSPTGGNLQNVRYIVLQDETEKFKKEAEEELYEAAKEVLKGPDANNMHLYAGLWKKMYEEDIDRLFYGGGTVVCTVSNAQIPGTLTAARIEEMAYMMGLGVCYCGFFCRAVNGSEKLRRKLGLKDDEQMVCALVLGYPDVRFQRTVPRKKADINWL